HSFDASLGDTGGDHTPHAVTDEDDVSQIFEFQHRGHIGHHGVECDLSMIEMVTFPEAGESRRPPLMTTAPEYRRHALPAPPSMPATVDEHVGCGSLS